MKPIGMNISENKLPMVFEAMWIFTGSDQHIEVWRHTGDPQRIRYLAVLPDCAGGADGCLTGGSISTPTLAGECVRRRCFGECGQSRYPVYRRPHLNKTCCTQTYVSMRWCPVRKRPLFQRRTRGPGCAQANPMLISCVSIPCIWICSSRLR